MAAIIVNNTPDNRGTLAGLAQFLEAYITEAGESENQVGVKNELIIKRDDDGTYGEISIFLHADVKITARVPLDFDLSLMIDAAKLLHERGMQAHQTAQALLNFNEEL